MRTFSRDQNRVFNKSAGFYKPDKSVVEKIGNGQYTNFYRTPVPVNISIDMNILTKYQTDMDQIMSNFIPFCNPYIILSWKVPEEYNLPFIEEIRSEVLWDGTVSVDYPTDIDGNKKFFIVGKTSFTIKGWIFAPEENPIKNIFFIDTAFTALPTGQDIQGNTYFSLSSQVIEKNDCAMYYNTEIISISAAPQITDVNYNVSY